VNWGEIEPMSHEIDKADGSLSLGKIEPSVLADPPTSFIKNE
jgi:hypothetical protein